ncbi:MAG: CARDB domain-containing protein [Nanoarchaeota archaeon]
MSKLVIGIIVIVVVVGIFALFMSDQPNLAPRTIKPALPDLTTSTSIINVLNNSFNGSVQYLVNYTVNYANIGNVSASNITARNGHSIVCAGGGGTGGGGGGFTIPVLNPNQVLAFQLSITAFCNGLWTSHTNIDLPNNIAESNENNNNATVSVTI